MNNKKLENYINEWKIIIEKFKNDAVKYCKEMNKIFTILKKIKSMLSYICIEKYYR